MSRNRTDATNDRDASDVPQNPLDFAAEYADARTDRRHIFNATYIYELPFFKTDPNAFLRWTLGGWQISGITTVSSGAPVPRLLIGTNTGRRGNRANLIGDPRGGEFDYPVWFDAAAFGIPADGEYGDSPRAPLRLPGRNQTDLALSKNFYFSVDRPDPVPRRHDQRLQPHAVHDRERRLLGRAGRGGDVRLHEQPGRNHHRRPRAA